jgi:quercetin dioxygenase-like cupin family protein
VKALSKLAFIVALSACAQRTVVMAPTPMPEPPLPGPSPIRMDGMIIAHAGPVTWGPAPAALPAGARAVILEGNPARAELFTLRVWVPANYVIPPHTHPAWEHVTGVSGTFHIGMGSTINMSNAHELRAGSFIAIPSGMRHWFHAATETVIQLHGMGPWNIVYVNRADDPRNR